MTRKLMATVVVALLVVPGLAQAQEGGSTGSLEASARVLPFSEVTGDDNLSFGDLSRTQDRVINAAGGADFASRVVRFNHNVRVAFTAPAALQRTGGTEQLAVTLHCSVQEGGSPWTTPADCSSAGFDLDVGSSISEATLGFGGVITANAAATAVAGLYRATMEIVVTAR